MTLQIGGVGITGRIPDRWFDAPAPALHIDRKPADFDRELARACLIQPGQANVFDAKA
jgi:hypothetical protein